MYSIDLKKVTELILLDRKINHKDYYDRTREVIILIIVDNSEQSKRMLIRLEKIFGEHEPKWETAYYFKNCNVIVDIRIIKVVEVALVSIHCHLGIYYGNNFQKNMLLEILPTMYDSGMFFNISPIEGE